MVKVDKDTEFGIARKGTLVAVGHRKGTPAGKPHNPWKIVHKQRFKDEGTAKAYYKDKLDALIKRYPDNVVRTAMNV